MSSYKTYENMSYCEFDYYNQPIFVPSGAKIHYDFELQNYLHEKVCI
jgi:hypothetical protein